MGIAYNVEIYKDGNSEWRWRIKATNGRIIGASTEGYKNKSDLINNIESINASFVQFFLEEER